MPVFPPTKEHPYEGAKATGAARASLQRALDNYKTGHINLPHAEVEGSDLNRSDTRSFGESHASELSSMSSPELSASTHPGIPLTPPSSNKPLSKLDATSPTLNNQTSPIDPSHLNLSPAPIPSSATPQSHNLSITEETRSAVGATPTIAETGVPVSAGVSGPGPASGSLYELRSPPESHIKWESAEEEKRRLGQAYSQAYQPQSAAAPNLSAEEEKRRLEREERDRLLQTGGSPADEPARKDDEDLPPYQDI